ncbi:MAG: hypothetical protein COA78_16230 [Blastopirellula sp.]|nr:MAG: hypothetical protein COA78_16230 [Blastopirellula sp.]
MYNFYASIHALPDAVVATSSPLQINSLTLSPLQVETEHLACPMSVSFEQAEESLAQLPNLFIEPDGSFVWVAAPDAEHRWQVDGVLYDRGDKMLYVEIKGSCPQPEFDQMLNTLGWPDSRLMFQATQHAVYLSEQDFRALCLVAAD